MQKSEIGLVRGLNQSSQTRDTDSKINIETTLSSTLHFIN